jgi:hypothetical protein
MLFMLKLLAWSLLPLCVCCCFVAVRGASDFCCSTVVGFIADCCYVAAVGVERTAVVMLC